MQLGKPPERFATTRTSVTLTVGLRGQPSHVRATQSFGASTVQGAQGNGFASSQRFTSAAICAQTRRFTQGIRSGEREVPWSSAQRIEVVGERGLEPPTSTSQTWRSTGLSYPPSGQSVTNQRRGHRKPKGYRYDDGTVMSNPQSHLRRAVIVSAVRTPTGRFLGGLSSFTAPQLGGIAIRGAVERARIDPGSVDGVYMGSVLQAGLGMAPARQAMLHAGLPEHVPAATINKVCGSSLMAVALAAQQIMLGEAEVIVAGGMESMSNAPHLFPSLRSGHKAGDATLRDAMILDGLWSPWDDKHVGYSAEAIAKRDGVSREAQDNWALRSHQRAIAAIDGGAFRDEIVPISIPGKRDKPTTIFDTDECPRRDTTASALASLRPAFTKLHDDTFEPTVTAGNASQLADGASALVVMSEGRAQGLGISPLARYVASANAAVAPQWLFEAPVPTVNRLLAKTGTRLADFDLFELNEAYAAQMVADNRALRWDEDRVNVHGGAIALGHPLGASGSRILATLIHALIRRGGTRGIASACLGGGEAFAIAVERP